MKRPDNIIVPDDYERFEQIKRDRDLNKRLEAIESWIKQQDERLSDK
jgi:hypothetical protein